MGERVSRENILLSRLLCGWAVVSDRGDKMTAQKKVWKMLLAVSLAGMAVCGGWYLNYRSMRCGENERYERLRELAHTGVRLFEPLHADASENPQEREIDFAALSDVNRDIYAWISLPGTGIDYPVVQSGESDDYYLNHDAQGNESTAGAIFSQSCTKKDFSDFHTVLYGHDMRDSSMFGALLLLESRAVMDRTNKVYLYLPEKTLEYQIFGAYVSDAGHLLENFDQEEVLDRIGYLAEIRYKAQDAEAFDWELFDTVTEEQNILTLSTCYHGNAEQRFLVQAVCTGEWEKGGVAE